MGELHQTILEIDLTDAEIVARADGSALHKTKQAWTVLTLYYVGGEHQSAWDGGLKPIIAEIVGETKIAGQERRVRRARFTTLAKALNWGSFDHSSKLYDELRRKAIDWMETQARDVAGGGNGSGLVPIRSGGIAIDLPSEIEGKTERKPRSPRRSTTAASSQGYSHVEVELRFAGGREAIAEPHSVSATWFNEDGSVGARTSGRFSRNYGGATIIAELPENVR